MSRIDTHIDVNCSNTVAGIWNLGKTEAPLLSSSPTKSGRLCAEMKSRTFLLTDYPPTSRRVRCTLNAMYEMPCASARNRRERCDRRTVSCGRSLCAAWLLLNSSIDVEHPSCAVCRRHLVVRAVSASPGVQSRLAREQGWIWAHAFEVAYADISNVPPSRS